ncbi:MAG: hypothetical protein Q8R79_03890 [Legionellaceae bacterium]|nr:hypothetical protein [Legionellaceae bacterium]
MHLKKITLFVFIFFVGKTVFADEMFCADPAIIDLTDRGSVTDTPCVVPKNKVLVEAGYQYQNLLPSGVLSNVPQMQITTGIAWGTEIFASLPSYNVQQYPSAQGFGAANFGAKTHLFGGKSWAVAGQGIITTSGGTNNFGSPKTGYAVNGIGSWGLSPMFTLAGMFGESSLMDPWNAGGARFNSFNYSVALGFTPVEKFVLYGEVFGETKTNAESGSGVDADLGILYVFNKSIVFDVEYADCFNGNLGGFKNYVGAGLTVLLG